jgi:amino acid adenylation domain-containing protein
MYVSHSAQGCSIYRHGPFQQGGIKDANEEKDDVMTVSSFSKTTLEESVYIFPASFAQQRLWFLDQLEPNSTTYNIFSTIRLRGLLNVWAFEQSLNAIIQRHEVLRTTFRPMEGQPMQVIAPTLTVPLSLVDLQNLPETEREAEVLRLTAEEAQRPFNLVQGPLVRATLLQSGTEEHMLLLTMHHIISDTWSIGVFLHELAELYEAFSTGRPSPLPELPIQYVDFAIWQREWLQGKVLEAQMAYWKQQLAGAPTVLELPTDRPRPTVPTRCGSIYLFTLSKHLTDALKTLSHREGVTLYMTLLATFNTLLHRYTGQDDIVIGSPIAGRNRVETEALIGFFVNTLALRTDLSGNPTFCQLLGRVREVSLEAQAHQDVPFEYLVKALQPERNPGQNPLFQVLLSLQPSLSGHPSGWTLNHTGTSKFDLSLICEDRPEGLIGWFEYSSDLFDTTTIARMAEHWQTLLEGIVADPKQRLSDLPLLTEAEQQQLLVEWNDTQRAYPRDQCIHELFEEQVERTPDAVAVVFENSQLTYRELNQRANQLARHLQALGVGSEVLVGICMERSLEMMIALLGTLKAGGAYIPLDPAYPRDRLAFMLQDAQVPVLLTQQRLLKGLPEHRAQEVCLDADWGAIAQESAANPSSEARADNLVYVIYTSGSTGKPKGVMVTQQNLVHSTCARMSYYRSPVKSFLLLSPFAYDSSVAGIFWTLCQGGRLVLAGQRPEQDPFQIAEVIAHHQVSHVLSVPSLYRLLLAQVAPQQLVSLQTVIVAGESCPRELADRHQALLPHTALFNEYGPTEAAVWSSVYEIRLQELSTRVPIGRPIANTQVYLLDRHLHPVPIGVQGELYIGGDGLARGYLNRPELTAERFIRHPFSNDPHARLYRTGDLARYLPDGNLEFLGRIDQQVKIRGFRIEPGEIEAVLSHHPAVREAVVVAREDTPGNKRLIAHVVFHEEQAATVADLQDHVLKALPAYMMPSAFVLLEALPLMPNGKVDRRRLAAPDLVRLTMRETFVAPTLLVQQQLVQIWEELLDVRPIGIRDNFFYLGGHSLLATRLVARIEQVCGKKIPLATLFAGPTIEDLANALQTEAEEGRSSRAHVVAVQASGSKPPFFYLHGAWNSEAFYCFSLARCLGPDQPFYALEPYNFDGLQVAPTIETMAAAHIRSLRTVQPEGPYLLGGFCNGGLVAYEMARQLHAQGQRVDLLVLIEPAYPPVLHKVVRGLISRVGNLLGLGQDKHLEWFLHLRHMYKYVRHQRRLEDLKEFRAIDPSIETLIPTADALRQDNIAISNWIIAGYGYSPYPGKVTLFCAREEPFGGVWRRKAAKEKDIEVHVIPGTHLGCLTDHVQALAEQLRMCLSKVQATELKE